MAKQDYTIENTEIVSVSKLWPECIKIDLNVPRLTLMYQFDLELEESGQFEQPNQITTD